MVEWVRIGAECLQPIYRQMRNTLLAGDYVRCGETPVRCQDPDVPAKPLQGFLWLAGRPDGDVVLSWRMDRRRHHVDSMLAGLKGAAQSDGYEAYASFLREHDDVTQLGC